MLLIQTSHCSIGTAVGYVIHMYVNYQRNLLIRLSGYTKCHRDVCSLVDFVPSSLLNKNNHNKTLEGESKKKKKKTLSCQLELDFLLFVCLYIVAPTAFLVGIGLIPLQEQSFFSNCRSEYIQVFHNTSLSSLPQ